MTDRRSFLSYSGLAAINFGMLPVLANASNLVAGMSPFEAASNEDFWAEVRRGFRLDGRFVDLQGNAVASAPSSALQEADRISEVVHSLPAYHLFRYGLSAKDRVRNRLANLLSADAEEIALVRNTTEAITTVVRGIEVETGQEVLTTNRDYPPLIRLLQSRAERENFTVKVLSWDDDANDDEIVERFAQAMTGRTAALMACHVLFRSGRILPIKRICGLARKSGVKTIIDGAHGFGHVPTHVRELDCDYYGTSLHKWAFGPIGTGFLYVRKQLITETSPLFMPYDGGLGADRIEKFEDPGTSMPIWPAINASLDLLEAIGLDRKMARHAYLTRHWIDQLVEVPGVNIRGMPGPTQGGGFAGLTIDGVEAGLLFRRLLDRHRLLVGQGEDEIKVGSQIYTRPADLDTFALVIRQIASDGIWHGATVKRLGRC